MKIMDNKDFVPYEPSLTLKELGFNEPCFAYYLEDGTYVPASYSKQGTVYPSNTDLLPEWCTAPTFSQAFRFFRKKYKMQPNINSVYNSTPNGFTPNGKYSGTIDDVTINKEMIATDTISLIPVCDTYEEAELACLLKLIEIIKKEK
jgi:hypothetical protein